MACLAGDLQAGELQEVEAGSWYTHWSFLSPERGPALHRNHGSNNSQQLADCLSRAKSCCLVLRLNTKA